MQKDIPMPVKLRSGNGWFLKHVYSRITRLVSRGGIILILRLFSEPCMKLFYGRVFPNQLAATRSASHLQRICLNPSTISAPSKSFLVIAMFQSLWFVPMSLTAAVWVFKPISTECASCWGFHTRRFSATLCAVIKGIKADSPPQKKMYILVYFWLRVFYKEKNSFLFRTPASVPDIPYRAKRWALCFNALHLGMLICLYII